MKPLIAFASFAVVVSFSYSAAAAAEAAKSDSSQHEIIPLWPGTAPGDKGR